ncbi:transcriptional repressor general negative regulator of transcription subunit 4 [Coemansia sp. RSA 986]|nr:transcriptional repressor general negative regulator of transcription subunit 4 [Coemansia sp. RSA 986]
MEDVVLLVADCMLNRHLNGNRYRLLMAKIKNEKRAKEREKREIESNNRRHLANVRVVQKNLVYVIGLPTNLATEETLRHYDYFGQFGRINKIVINRRQTGSSTHVPTVGVYVTYATKEESTRAINAVDGSMLENRVLRATFGTTKYCSYYLRNIPCQNPNCMYLHEPGEEADSFTKEDLAATRVGMKEQENPHDSYEEDGAHSPSSRAATQSPNVHLGTSRIVAVSSAALSGSLTSRTQSATSVAPVTSSTSASRLRKSSEVNGLRPRSVEPGGNTSEGGGGSALPATASWASRAMGKKPASGSHADSRPRKSESGGTMTLRMIPASRAKTAAHVAPVKPSANSISSLPGQQLADSANAAGTATAVSSTKSRTKGSASLTNANIASVDGAPLSLASGKTSAIDTASTGSSSATNPHHSGLQQLTRERKQQLRHQSRLQQKLAETADLDTGSDADIEADIEADTVQKRNNARSKSVDNSKGSVNNTGSLERESLTEVASATRSIPSEAQATTLETAIVDAAAQPGQQDEYAATAVDSAVHLVQPHEQAISAEVGAQNPHAPPDYANSALSFQSITDSLFAQLNAKVFTATPANTVPGFSGIGPLDGHSASGMRASGYPASGVDPLLFAPSVSSEAPSAGIPDHSGSGVPLPSFSLFSGQPMSQWSNLAGAVPGGYPQSSLVSLTGEPNVIGAPMAGALREAPGGSGFGQNPSRPKSRWDFAHADEASAQAELQSVLGRGFSGGAATHGQQQTQSGLGMGAALATSRDLGMFSTPVQNDYTNGPWGNAQSSQQRQQANGAMASFAPPGFGGRHHTENSRNDVRSLSPLTSGASSMVGAGAIGSNTQGSAGPNTLLSRLIGQPPTTGSSGGGSGNEALSNAMSYQNYQQQLPQLAFQDPSILLSRLQLGRGDNEAEIHSGIGTTMAPQQPQQYGMAASGTLSVPPGIVPFNTTTGTAISSSIGVGSAAQAPSLRFQTPYVPGETTLGGIISSRSASTAPGSPLGPPPGIRSPPSGEAPGGQGQARMVSRSANSSGRSRFLNHFSGEEPSQQRAMNSRRHQEGQTSNSSVPGNGSRNSDMQNLSETQSESEEGRMVNGVPPGLPTTGLFGELLRRAKQQGIPTGPTNVTPDTAAAGVNDSSSGPFVSGKVMLSDIERKLDAARREAQELQAQLTSVIGQNQSAMMALAHSTANSSSNSNSNSNSNNISSSGGANSGNASGPTAAASGMV